MGNKEKRITLFADSLALPRGKDWGNIPFERTYPYLLEKKLREKAVFQDFIFTNRAQRFRTIVQTESDFRDFAELNNTEIIILHSGIVDCAPRVFTQTQRKWIENLPSPARRIILKIIKFARKAIILTISKNKTYVSPDHFKKSLESILGAAKETNAKVILLNIISPPDDLEQRSPGFQTNVKIYNKIIDDTALHYKATVIDLDTWIHKNGGHDELTCDGMHINERGHAFVSESLLKLVETT